MKSRLFYSVLLILTSTVIVLVWFAWEHTTLVRPIPCSKFIDSRLQAVDWTQLKPSSELDWIDNQFWFGRQRTRDINGFNGEQHERWTWDTLDNHYDLYTIGDNIWFRQAWRFSIPITGDRLPNTVEQFVSRRYQVVTMDDMLRCLGKPNAYLSVTDPGDLPLHTVQFLYPLRGYIVTGQWFYSLEAFTEFVEQQGDIPEALQISGTTPLLFVAIFPPNTAQDMTRLFYHRDEKCRDKWAEAIEPWPDDISKIKENPKIIQHRGDDCVLFKEF